MTQVQHLTPAQVLLLATQLTTESDLPRLQVLAATHKDVLTPVALYRLLLTFLPIDSESQPFLSTFLQHVLRNFDGVSEVDLPIDVSSVEGISVKEIDRNIQELRFSHITSTDPDHESDPLSNFLKQWTYRTEATVGLSTTQIQLIDTFLDGRPQLQQWRNTYLLPLYRLQNDFYPGQADGLSLQTLEQTFGEAGVRLLLQFAEALGPTAEIGRDLTEVVTPWVQGSNPTKRRKMDDGKTTRATTRWEDVYSWIFTTSETRFDLAAKSIIEWAGPPWAAGENNSPESDYHSSTYVLYAQTTLAVIVGSPSRELLGGHRLRDLLQRAIEMALQGQTSTTETAPLESATKSHLLRNQLHKVGNPITSPSEETLKLISNGIDTQDLLESFAISLSIANIADISLFGSEERQKQELVRILSQMTKLMTSEHSWTDARVQIQKLRSGGDGDPSSSTATYFLGRLPQDYIDSEILATMLNAGQYSVVFNTYLVGPQPPLEKSAVRDKIVAAIFDAYDNASNGNRTRGGIKKASDLLKSFQTAFLDEAVFTKIDFLIKATHSLSFYQLTLQHGTPFRPVNLRVHHDPLSLIEKVLQQNSKAYTKLDDLLDIGRNLVKSDITTSPANDMYAMTIEEQIFEAMHRITYLAIASALDDHDFDTAYSYITTRLSTSPSQVSSAPYTDDTSWRAAYAAGRYRPLTPEKSIHERITSLSKRMDLLSLALTLAPSAEPLSEILATWRRSEEEMDSLRFQALDEERSMESASNVGGGSMLPGGFAPDGREIDVAETRRMHDRRANAGFSPTYEEEAPMGLFDIARGAASAFKNSAFPLTGAGRREGGFVVRDDPLHGRNTSPADYGDDGNEMATDSQKTRRKRDVVSGIVTGGLVSGMSWVLGAPPTAQREEPERG